MKIDKFISEYNCCMTPPPGRTWEDLGKEMKIDLLKVVNFALKEEREKNDWISVKDRLPKQCIDVLICIEEDSIYMAGLNDIIFERVGYIDLAIYEVAYWMPLPEPPTTYNNKT